jgi:TonB-linked SusC/RagA family outer membrane protein
MWELDATPTAGQVATGNSTEWALESVFGRLNYDYAGKYLFEANFRYDASSRFPVSNRWALFPSFSAGWRISEEGFMKNDWLSNLKLRASWGQLGNQLPLSNYPYQDALTPTLYNIAGSVMQGWYLQKMVNANIKWETTTATDFGLDFGFLKGKIFGSVDWYNKTTSGILRQLQVPLHAGLSAPYINNGELRNRGWEINIGHENTINDFHYAINFNFDSNRNKVLKFGSREIDGSGYIRQEGLPYNSYYMYIFDGVYQNSDEIAALKPLSPLTKAGDMKLKDLDGDNKITPEGDRVVVDGAFPNFNYGFNINADYKNIDLSMFFQGVSGKKVYVKEWGIAPFRQGSVPSVYWRGAWTEENPNNSIPHVFYDNYAPDTYINTFYLQDASYLRLKNIQLGYSLPQSTIRKIGIQNLRIYLSGDNLLTFSNMFQGIDPERVALNSRGVIYPQSKIYSFGLKVTL